MSKTYRCGKCNTGNLESPTCTCTSTVFYEERVADTPDEWLTGCVVGEMMNCSLCPHDNTPQCHALRD